LCEFFPDPLLPYVTPSIFIEYHSFIGFLVVGLIGELGRVMIGVTENFVL
jgi:hypothetical protein